jgi:hypothetical protein
MDPDALCDATEMSTMGVCLRFCEPQDTYVSTSDCPEGSRCFTFDPTVALCYPDCEVDADCTSGVCDSEGGCVASDPVLMDGGVGDGGTDDGGTDDGGTDDGGTADGMADSGMPDSGV